MRLQAHRPTRPALRGWAAASLVALLLAAQSLGLWHRTVHAPGLSAGAGHVERHRLAAQASAFGHDAGQTDECRLFDQLALADVLAVAPAVLPVEALRPVAIGVAATTVARSATALYQARAPPLEA